MQTISIKLNQEQVNELLEIFSGSLTTGNLKFARLTTKFMEMIETEVQNVQNQNVQQPTIQE